MLSETEKRAATIAVSRYGADRRKVQQAVRAVLKAHADGEGTDLFDVLVGQRLITIAQAQELRVALDSTKLDLHSPARNKKSDGAATDTVEDVSKIGNYRLLRRLGEGGMGEVFLGYQERDNEYVAIKILPDHSSDHQPSVDRFYREAKSGALLDHPNIVRNIAAGQDSATNKHYLVLEYVDGPSAQALLDRLSHLPVGDAVHIIVDIARALEHLHSRNIVHRDIKPSNILITQSGVAKLSDLGLAKRTDETSHLTVAKQGFGTPYYMPYEQAINAKHADARSDIYALGGTLYHLVTGEVPFSAPSHVEIVEKKNLGFYTPASLVNPDVPNRLDQILAKMMARNPRDRYQIASELIVDLERSNLAAAVPTFVDPDLAKSDPSASHWLIAAAEPTCLDMQMQAKLAQRNKADPEIWYVRYRDKHGQPCKAKMTHDQIESRLADGKLSTRVEVSRKHNKGFKPVSAYAEFRKAIKAAPKRRRRKAPIQNEIEPPAFMKYWWLTTVAATGVIVAVLASWWLFSE